MSLLENDFTAEVGRLLAIIKSSGNFPGSPRFKAADIEFVRAMVLRMDRGQTFTRGQVFWLRDIKDKCE